MRPSLHNSVLGLQRAFRYDFFPTEKEVEEVTDDGSVSGSGSSNRDSAGRDRPIVKSSNNGFKSAGQGP